MPYLKLRIIICYFLLKIWIQTFQNKTNTWKQIEINFTHFFYQTYNGLGYFEKCEIISNL